MKNRTKTSSRLADLTLFTECTKAQLTAIDSLVTAIQVPKGRVLMHQGTAGSEFVVIAEGQVAVTRATTDGVEQIAELNNGDFVGEMALLNGAPRSATVTAATDLLIYASNPAEFREMLRTSPVVAERIAGTSSSRTARDGGAGRRLHAFTPAA